MIIFRDREFRSASNTITYSISKTVNLTLHSTKVKKIDRKELNFESDVRTVRESFKKGRGQISFKILPGRFFSYMLTQILLFIIV